MADVLTAALAVWIIAPVATVLVLNHRATMRRRVARYEAYAASARQQVLQASLVARLADRECRCGVGSPLGAAPWHRRPGCD